MAQITAYRRWLGNLPVHKMMDWEITIVNSLFLIGTNQRR